MSSTTTDTPSSPGTPMSASEAGAVTETATLAGAVNLAPRAESGTDIRRADGPLDWQVRPHPTPSPDAERAAILADPGFGRHFSDHMATATWTAELGWHDPVVGAFAPLQLSPATAVLHYAQSIFEGLKAYRHADSSVHLFRPQANAERFARSAHRMALPKLPVEDFLSSLTTLVTADLAWVPEGGESSLYLRPMMFGNEVFLGVRPSVSAQYAVIASPAGSYFAGGPVPVSLWVSDQFIRAAPGGTGAAKCGSNYAASLLPQQEAIAHGCDQVVFLDASEHRFLEELGGMNVFVVGDDDTVLTPPLTGTILEGVTRDAILALAGELGYSAEQGPIELAQLRADVASGRVREVFACGTAAVVTPIGRFVQADQDDLVLATEPGPVTSRIRSALLDLQYGRREDTAGWLTRVA